MAEQMSATETQAITIADTRAITAAVPYTQKASVVLI
jgi:hypothetical protein